MSDDHVTILDFQSNPNVGLYAFATDTYCLVGAGIEPEKKRALERTLKVPVHEITLAGTDLIGVFCAGNTKGIVIPHIVFDRERKILDDLGVTYTVIETLQTALGNNVLVNDHHALVHPELEEKAKLRISEALGVPVIEMKIAGLPIVGAVGVLREKHAIVHHDIEEFESKLLEVKLKVKVTQGSVNMGSPYVSSGLVVNKHGFAVGSASGGPEIDHIDHALGFIE